MPQWKPPASAKVRVEGAGQRRVDIFRAEHVQAVRVRIRDGERRVPGQLAFYCKSGLNDIRSAEVAVDFLNHLIGLKTGSQRGNVRNIGEKQWISDHVLLLDHAVITVRGKRVRKREAV